MSKSPVTCHVLDSAIGKPAAGVAVELHEHTDGSGFTVLATGTTDADGRCMQLWPEVSSDGVQTREERAKLKADRLYKVTFRTKDYFASSNRKCFYPWVEITFQVQNPDEHYHIPLLISPHSYTTYRGS